MVRLKYFVIMGGVSLLLTSCSGGSETSSAPTPPLPVPVASPSPSPTLQAGTAPAPQVALVRPTDPTVRVKEIRVGRSDPFASVAPPPAPKPELVTPPVSRVPPSGSAPRPGAPGMKPGGPPPLPPLPQPEQARGVKVLGVAMVRGVPQAIVMAPDEKVTRTVVAGDRLSNGLVLVKAIDMNRPEPVVILEQYGQIIQAQIGQNTVAQVPAGR